jgi:zinc protease
MRTKILAVVMGLMAGHAGWAADPSPIPDIDIPYTRFILDNGLTLIVHEDHKAPIVAVNIWYHVGSKNEKPGKTGFAHLFEHLMFNGSENFNDDYFKAMDKVGATDLNGTTSEDRTNYFENAPKDALDFLLWMESDRMGHLLGAISQAKLDEQRGVVQNEKRQGENQPYAIAYELITKNTWPAGHPYSWRVIGSMEDLNAASLEDVKDWFRAYYGAGNATLVVAGDVEAKAVLEKVKTYFGDIPSGPPVARHKAWIAQRTGVQRQVAQDRVPQARLYKVWNIPQYGDLEAQYLDLAAGVLAGGKTSRLYKRLVYDDQVATSVSASAHNREIAGQFTITAAARPGEGLEKIEKAIDEEVARFLAEGPTEMELRRLKTQAAAEFIRGVERIGGFGGKSDLLAMNQNFLGQPDFHKTELKNLREATAKNVQEAARKWLSDGVYILEVQPFPKFTAAKSAVDRSHLPVPVLKPEARFPELRRTTLDNGLKIILAERHSIPVVQFNLVLDAGFAADQFAVPGTARLAMDMLEEGTQKRTSLQISDELDLLGAGLQCGCDLDTASVHLSALNANLDASLEIFADVILHPAFPEADFKRLQRQRLASIQREKAEPMSLAQRIYPQLLYGRNHAYGNPASGSGTEASVAKLTAAELRKFHQTWFNPRNATLIIVGDATLEQIKPKIERLFQDWQPGETPKKVLAKVEPPAQTTIYLVDRPGAQQSVIYGANLAPPKVNDEEIALETVNFLLGGTFTSRINMNLREDKHWTYGAKTAISGAKGQRSFICYAPVQSDKTRESLVEMTKEMRGILGDQPVTEAELEKAITSQTLKLPGSWETMSRVAGAITELVRYGLPEDYYQTYPEKVRQLTRPVLTQAAPHLLRPGQFTWLVIGDRAKVEASLRESKLGEVIILDADGKRLGQ